jgi:hypothetical protein
MWVFSFDCSCSACVTNQPDIMNMPSKPTVFRSIVAPVKQQIILKDLRRKGGQHVVFIVDLDKPDIPRGFLTNRKGQEGDPYCPTGVIGIFTW